MPDNKKPARRSIPVGTYNNKLHTQGKSTNVTARFLEDVGHDQTGLQELYRSALNDIPDPINPGKTLSYGQVVADMRTPAGQARAEAYGRAKGLQGTMKADAYAQAVFEEARGRLLQRAAQNPGQLAFDPAAAEAFMAPRRAAMMADPNYTKPEGEGQIMDANTLRQFFTSRPQNDGTAYVAPSALVRRSIPVR